MVKKELNFRMSKTRWLKSGTLVVLMLLTTYVAFGCSIFERSDSRTQPVGTEMTSGIQMMVEQDVEVAEDSSYTGFEMVSGEELFTVDIGNSRYTAVRYGDTGFVVFDSGGKLVSDRDLAESVHVTGLFELLNEFDKQIITQISELLSKINDSLSVVRKGTNTAVAIFDDLDDIGYDVPSFDVPFAGPLGGGRITALSVVSAIFPPTETFEETVRQFDDGLNQWSYNINTLTTYADDLTNLQQEQANQIVINSAASALTDIVGEVNDLADILNEIIDSGSNGIRDVADLISDFAGVLNEASSIPVISDQLSTQLSNYGQEVDEVASQIKAIESDLRDYANLITSAADDLEEVRNKLVTGSMLSWIQVPSDDNNN